MNGTEAAYGDGCVRLEDCVEVSLLGVGAGLLPVKAGSDSQLRGRLEGVGNEEPVVVQERAPGVDLLDTGAGGNAQKE